MSDLRTNFGVSNETLSLTNRKRNTIPLNLISQNPVQRKGSLFFDTRTLKLYYSDGANWLEIISSSGGNVLCIEDADGNTSVCTDTTPETNSETIYFTTGGTLRSIFNPNGIFIATAGAVNPTTIVPAAGKVAYFGGDIDVTGVVDPTGVQFEEQAVTPVDPTGGTTGVIYVRNDVPNTLIFVDNAGVEHNLLAAGTTVWQEISSVISPITATEISVICGGVTNTLNPSAVGSVICGGNTNAMDQHSFYSTISGSNSCSIIGTATKQNCFVTGTSHTISGNNVTTGCGIFGGSSGSIDSTLSSTNTMSNCCIVGGDTNSILQPTDNSIIIGGTGNSVVRSNRTAIVAGEGCFTTGLNVGHNVNFITGLTNQISGSNAFAEACAVLGGRNNTISSQFSASTSLLDSCIIGGDTNTISMPTNRSTIIGGLNNTLSRCIETVIAAGSACNISGTNATHRSNFISGTSNNILGSNSYAGSCAIIGGDTNTITAVNFALSSLVNSCIIGGNNNTIDTLADNAIVIGGNNATASHNNSFIFSSGTALSTSAASEFTVKASGGSRIFSNDLATTGVTLAAGANAWAAVSDRNKKENLIEVSYFDILERVDSLPIYNYNLIGNPKEQKCIGPVAQDWHSKVTPLNYVIEEKEDPENPSKTIKVEREAKDKLSIETMDAIGVCLAAIKALKKKNDYLETENNVLKQQLQLQMDYFTSEIDLIKKHVGLH